MLQNALSVRAVCLDVPSRRGSEVRIGDVDLGTARQRSYEKQSITHLVDRHFRGGSGSQPSAFATLTPMRSAVFLG